LACPYFMPTRRMAGGAWPHPSRLPLGAGWSGYCCAPGHEGAEPSVPELEEGCNLGYATSCERLPQSRTCDAVRFSISRERGQQVVLWFVCEARHQPVEHGTLEYDVATRRWISFHRDARIQKMAECYLESYLQRKFPPPATADDRALNP